MQNRSFKVPYRFTDKKYKKMTEDATKRFRFLSKWIKELQERQDILSKYL